jgi:hypothetical protein
VVEAEAAAILGGLLHLAVLVVAKHGQILLMLVLQELQAKEMLEAMLRIIAAAAEAAQVLQEDPQLENLHI